MMSCLRDFTEVTIQETVKQEDTGIDFPQKLLFYNIKVKHPQKVRTGKVYFLKLNLILKTKFKNISTFFSKRNK